MGNLDVTAYLHRLGCAAEPPSADALRRLHSAHIERVPYEALEIALERVTPLAPEASVARFLRGRGGYCYHLNGAFSALLRALGYQVTRHLSGVQSSAGDAPNLNRSHLGLTVTGLPDDPETTWFADVGLGDGLYEPVPLRYGEFSQGPHTYRLRASDVVPGGWRFDHDPAGSFAGMDFAPGAAEMPDFAERHHWLSTSPESGFVRVCVVQSLDSRGVDTLRALTLTRSGDVEKKQVLESPEDWWAALADVFGIPADAFTGEERERLWRLVLGQHEAHLAGAAGSEVVPSA
ncbi:arylamine N-acetyltransferase [Amycolatopsis sp. NPDC059021]|uniref:arylamine N-acetyltransferase family protein n=1 Tax=Amycolatopsis sp. NPDC059021 TaxID=3346704 RepID=UPI003671A028